MATEEEGTGRDGINVIGAAETSLALTFLVRDGSTLALDILNDDNFRFSSTLLSGAFDFSPAFPDPDADLKIIVAGGMLIGPGNKAMNLTEHSPFLKKRKRKRGRKSQI